MNKAVQDSDTERLDDLHVLVVDDEADTRDLLPRLLTRRGAQVLTAHDGKEGLRLFAEYRPHVVISDIRMPEMDGITMCRKIREMDSTTPIVIISAHNEIELLHSSIELGVVRYLTKPADVEVLMEMLYAISRDRKGREGEQKHMQRVLAESENQNSRLNAYVAEILSKELRSEMSDIQYLDIPMDKVSGDLFCTAKHGQVTYALVADGTGHGLAAVVPILQVPRIFKTMAAKNFSLLAIADEINRELRKLNFIGHFLAATLIRMDGRDGYIEVLNCGNPSALLVNREQGVLHEFRPSTFALGMVGGDDFNVPIERYKCEGDANIFVFTDGLTDTLAAAMPDMDYEGLRKFFDKTPTGLIFEGLKRLVSEVVEHVKMDDITLVELAFNIAREGAREFPRGREESAPVRKTVGNEIKSADVLVVAQEEADIRRYEQCLGNRVSRLHVARNSDEALVLFANYQPQLIIADVPMQTMKNRNMVEIIRRFDAQIPILVAGIPSGEGYIERLLELKVSRFIAKPILDLKLIRTVSECIQQYRDITNARLPAAVFETLPLAVLITNKNKEIIAVNPAFSRITGYEMEELVGRDPKLLSSGKQDADFYREMWQTISRDGLWSGRIWNRRKNGDLYYERVTINAITDANGEVTNYVATFIEMEPPDNEITKQ